MSSATEIFCNGCSRTASSIAAMGLNLLSGAANTAKTTTAAAAAFLTTAIAVDSYLYYQKGINYMPELYYSNNCNSPAPIALNIFSRTIQELDCETAAKTFPKYFQLQFLLLPVVVTGLALGYRAFGKVEQRAALYAEKFEQQWSKRQLLDHIEFSRLLKKVEDEDK